MTATRLAASSSSGSLPPDWVSVKDYGATGDGATDDTAAINAAINAAHVDGVTSKVVYFPNGTYNVSSTLNCNNTEGMELRGPGGRKSFFAKPTIQYTAATGNAITCLHTSGFTMKYLRIRASNAAYNADLVDTGAAGGDTTQMNIHECGFSSNGPATSLIRMNYVIISTIEKCHFGRAVQAIKVGDGNYCVAVSIRDCTTNSGNVAGDFAIHTREGAESILMEGNTFEAQGGTYGGAWWHSGGVAWQVTFDNNWMGDQSDPTYPWIKNDGDLFGFSIKNNRFTGVGAMKAIDTGGSGTWAGGEVSGNYCDNMPINLSGYEVYIRANKLLGSTATCNVTYAQNIGTGPGGFNVNAGFPVMGFGLSGGVQPKYGLDVQAGSDHRAMRLLNGGVFFGGSAGAQDAPIGLNQTTYGLNLHGGEGAAGANNTAFLLNRTTGDPGAPTDAAFIYSIDDAADTKSRFKIRDENTSGWVGKYVRGTTTWNPASVANGAITTTTVTVSGAAVGDPCAVGFPFLVGAAAATAGLTITGQVTAANTVTVVLRNDTGGAVDLDSGTLVAHAWKH